MAEQLAGSTLDKSVPNLVIHKQSKQAEYFTENLGNGVQIGMICVPAGDFMMGSPDSEPERLDWEGPQHLVTVPDFYLGRYPVTQEQWRTVAGYPRVNLDLEAEPSHFKGDMRPVERVSWYEVVEFCHRLHQHTGRPYRLPSEAEWEYACRAGTRTPFYFGKSISPFLANYDARQAYADGPTGDGSQKTSPVNHFGIANAFGLSDMHGNVFEWCQDDWHETYDGAPMDGSAWLNKNDNRSQKVYRGGSWLDYPNQCRSASRNYDDPAYQDPYLGLRVACSAPRTL